MIVVMKNGATREQVDHVAKLVREMGLKDHVIVGTERTVVAVIGVCAGNLLGGTVIIETLFNWPGLSSLLVRACYDRDYPLIQGTLLAIFALFVLVSLVVDLVLGLLDPKLRDA